MHTALEREHLGGTLAPFSGVPGAAVLNPSDLALVKLGQDLKKRGYQFTTITPASHDRVNARPAKPQTSLADIFGWSHIFAAAHISAQDLARLATAGALEFIGAAYRSSVRFSTLGDQLFAHSAFPTEQSDAVFFGPDTYRFIRFIQQSWGTMKHAPSRRLRVLDVGTGTGILAIAAAKLVPEARVEACDTDEAAVAIARENAEANGVAEKINFRVGSVDDSTPSADLVCANLTADVISQMLQTLVSLSCGKLILSGILETQIELVQSGLHACGIDDFEVAQDGEWVALII